MAIRPIVEMGVPLLRKKSTPIQFDGSSDSRRLDQLVVNLVDTLNFAKGVGIAAPQIGVLQRVFLLAPDNIAIPIINPLITGHTSKKVKDWEGCLSIPGIRGLIPRWETIDVEYLDMGGKKHRRTFSGFHARIFQHELDHLDGILLVDRITSNMNLITDKVYAARMEEGTPPK